MKIRLNYVSNSSSSSFLITEDLNNKGVVCLKLTRAQKERINGSILYDNNNKVNIYPDKDYWLTEFISDYDDRKWNIVTSVEHITYESGQMCGEPYVEEYFNEYSIDGDTSVYLRKEHDDAKQMKFNKFVKEFKNTYGTSAEVIVNYEKDGNIILKVVKI